MEPFLQCNKIWKWFHTPEDKLIVLKDLDFELERGEFVSIVGESGVGKSTFLHLVGFLDEPSKGELILNGIDYKMLSNSEKAAIRASTIGFVFQFHHLLTEFTALENLIIPGLISGKNGRGTTKRAKMFLKAFGILNKSDHYPRQLSGGEAQRISLARALMNKPQLLLADEPTGNLDEKNSEVFMDYLEQLRNNEDITVIFATHNMELAKRAERILNLKDGHLSEMRIN